MQVLERQHTVASSRTMTSRIPLHRPLPTFIREQEQGSLLPGTSAFGASIFWYSLAHRPPRGSRQKYIQKRVDLILLSMAMFVPWHINTRSECGENASFPLLYSVDYFLALRTDSVKIVKKFSWQCSDIQKLRLWKTTSMDKWC